MRLHPRGMCRIAVSPWLKQAVSFVHTLDSQKLNTSGDRLASLCTPPVPASKGQLPGSTRYQRRCQPQRSFLTPSLMLPGKNNPAEEEKRARGSSAFHPPEHNPAPPQSASSCRERCSCAGSRGFLAAPSCLASVKSFPCQRCRPASQPRGVIEGSAALGLLPTGALG